MASVPMKSGDNSMRVEPVDGTILLWSRPGEVLMVGNDQQIDNTESRMRWLG
jgi:hypothetical protein